MNNTQVIKNAFAQFKQDIDDEIYKTLDDFCRNLLLDAVIENRRRNPEGHQFTGNLINSIVVIMYEKANGGQSNYFAYDDLKAPIRKEMSAKTSRGTERKRAIHFRPDWQNTPHTIYRPEVVTDESFGPNDARGFASSWLPSNSGDFEICVAYTSEYADWVEQHHHTTGFLSSIRYAKKAMISMGFKKIG